MSEKRSILYIDDETENLSTLRRVLRSKYEVHGFDDPAEALDFFRAIRPSVVVADQRMPKQSGVEFLKEIKGIDGDVTGVILTAYSDIDALIEGINAGVIYRYISKPWEESDLYQAMRQAFERFDLAEENRRLMKELRQTNAYLREEVEERFDVSAFAGAMGGLKKVADLIGRVAKTNSTVLVRGESGVGKELVARAIHQSSARRNKPFVRVNCGALTESLLESELFGHEKGAFTGASSRRIGRFEAAGDGTIFLDEIGDVSSKLQVSLLRVLQEREFERVGGNQTLTCNARMIAATHQNLEEMCKVGKMREDLYYRLNVFPVPIPPLRKRMEDLPSLVERLLQKAARNTGLASLPLSKAASEKLHAYDWPGNVRELENVIERGLILATGPELEADDLVLGPGLDHDGTIGGSIDGAESDEEGRGMPAKEITRELLEETLRATGGNKVAAAKRLGLKRPTLYYHLKRLNLG